ncbi:sensor histidine kinase [Pseudohongiella sp.]|uniref:Histidine kinase/HSP90-like ATPase domain-containing protein n=1 Tax=marine sediment metagenome TaxID=412755 RepID=A0A0F9WGI1_9ZZZZ|nr:ATP-binding protein [Pseudohongiella sp.]HDZ09204.1 hypothetical protein [Pseudohongiella sp.]HEA63368.1 hypothetical protein [Pseudohongiella sp.]
MSFLLKLFIRILSGICLVLLSTSLLAQAPARPALLTSTPVTVADLPVQSGRTGSLILLPGPVVAESDVAGGRAAVGLIRELQADGVPVLPGTYAHLQQILQQRDLLFWQIPVWTGVVNLLVALILLLVLLRKTALPLLRWLFSLAFAGNLYYLPMLLSLPAAVQLTVNVLYFIAILIFLRMLQTSVSALSGSGTRLPQAVFRVAVLSLLLLIGVDSVVLIAGLELANHPGMTPQLVPVGQLAGVLAALYFLTSRHAEMRAELTILNASLDQRVAEATAELQQRYRQLTRDALEAARMNERSVIYQSIHEDLGDKLLQLMYSAGDRDTMDLARSALAELRDSRSLLPDHCRPLTEVLADIRSEAQSRCDQAGIALNWQQDGALAEASLNARQHSALGRTVREAFSNLLKHARASTATVSVRVSDSRLFYSIGDNGKGIAAQFSPGRGLINMHSRVKELGGTLRQSSAPEGGTTLEFMLPLRAAAEGAPAADGELAGNTV